jgi:hypothetical protein
MSDLRSDERGMNLLIIPLVIALVFLLATLGFGLWAYSSRQDFKNNVDQKIAAAVDIATKKTATDKDNEFIQREKQPLKTYTGPSAYGTVQISFPKTWSAYIDDSGKGNAPLDAYFHPDFVHSTQDQTFNNALRVQVLNRTFSQELQGFDAQIKQGKATATPYKPVNVANVVGEKIEGEITTGKQGIIILLPLRDKTIKISTEAEQYKKDFNENVLPNFSFTP